MKKALSLVLVLAVVMTCFVSPAFAAGKLGVLQENLHVTDGYSVYAYSFGKVKNTGDKPVEFSAGLLEVYDANGDTLTSTDYLRCYPKYLNPGETGFIYAYDKVDGAESSAVVDDYMLTVTGKSTTSETIYYPATAMYQPGVQISKYTTYDYITAEITNNTEETVFDMNVVMALMDDQDNVLYVYQHDFYNTGINPGSTITYRESLSKTWYEAWEREGVTPTHVEVIAYKEVRN